MTGTRRYVAAGMGAAFVWTVALIFLGWQWPLKLDLIRAMMLALVPAGLVMAAMVARLAAGRFFDDHLIDGQPFTPGSAADVTQRCLTNSVEQTALAVCLRPAASGIAGPGLVVALGIGFGVTRVAFWRGYARSPRLRAFGFAAGFYPTLMAGLLSAVALVRAPV